ncbi:NAD(P)/FAD-dependent oxidoreductase [Gordonia terrae]|uniref:NAD(P)/FAD-dependent oxidoreductase n=1 Tax=Gordonia terrae TaxID=2055 RepID=UPI003F6B5483
MISRIVVAGAGEAGCQTAASLRSAGFDGHLVLLGDEGIPPYQRPPLSKGYLGGDSDDSGLWLRSAEFYARNAIELRCGDALTRINRHDRTVQVSSGEAIRYDHLVLALGARSRWLDVPGARSPSVLAIRTLADADRLKESLGTANAVVVIGGGFIGLEIASTVAESGRAVTVVQAGPRVLNRAISPITSAHLLASHRQRGIEFVFDSGVAAIEASGDGVTGVHLTTGQRIPADLVVVGIGAEPVTGLAASAGLSVDDGIVVDRFLRTSDPHISAVGDCARSPNIFAEGRSVRLESIQNAKSQAKALATGLATDTWAPSTDVPWFWSDQADMKLQMVGLQSGSGTTLSLPTTHGSKLAVACFDHDDVLVRVESINSPADHLIGKKILAQRIRVTRSELVEANGDLRAVTAKGHKPPSVPADRAAHIA